MYTSFTIENFRLFDQLTVEPLARVNLIAGQNNAGKTALLEALWLHSGPNIPELALRLAGFRGIPGPNPRRLLHDIFYEFDDSRKISLSGCGDWGSAERTLKISSRPAHSTVPAISATNIPPEPVRGFQESDFESVSPSEILFDYTDEHGKDFVSVGRWVRAEIPTNALFPNLPPVAGVGLATQQAPMPERPSCVFLSARQRSGPEEDAERFGESELAGHSDRILHCLQQVDPRIKRLTTISAPPVPMIHADVGLSRPVPMGFLGDGVGRLLSTVLAFYTARGGAILIDEVENGLHHTVLIDVWKNLDWLSREFNAQVFATTHSYECIVAANNAFTELESADLHLHRLYRRNASEPVKAITYTKEMLDTNVEYFWELR